MIGETIFTRTEQEGKDEYTLEELLNLLQQEGLTDPERAKEVTQQQRRNIQKARQEMSKPEYEFDGQLVSKGYNCFSQVKGKVEELSATQQIIESVIRKKANPLYYTFGNVRESWNRYWGRSKHSESIDELVDKRTETIRELHDTMKESEDYAVQLLETLRDYKMNYVMKQLESNAEYNTALEAEKAKMTRLAKSVKTHLDKAVPKDKGYRELSVAWETLNTMISYSETEITKTNIELVNRNEHKKSLNVFESLIGLSVEYCDVIALNMANVVETMQYSVPVMQSIEQQGNIAMLSENALDPITEYVMQNMEETKRISQKMDALSTHIKQGSLPATLAKVLGNHTGLMTKSNRASSKDMEAEAKKILTQPGYTT